MLDKIWLPRTPQHWFWTVLALIWIPPIAVSQLFGSIGFVWWLILSGLPILALLLLKRMRTHGLPGVGVVRADFTVPHTAFTPTADGFIVEFSKMPLWIRKFLASLSVPTGQGQTAVVGLIQQLVGLAFSLVIWTIALVYWIAKTAIGIGTRIEVSRDKIKIDSKTFDRSAFGGFLIGKGFQASSGESLVVLNYQYGARSFPFGGAWEIDKANEVASALNTQLRLSPKAGDESQPAPEQLRSARPNEF
jgi:hypothetical protein